MDVDGIKDEYSLRAWFEARPGATRQADALAIAQRAAMRVFPFWSRGMGEEWARAQEFSTLPLLRCYLTSGVAREFPTPEFRSAAAEAARVDAASPTASAFAVVAAVATADAAAAARSAGIAMTLDQPANWQTILWDALQIEAGIDPSSQPLWPDTPPDWIIESEQEGREIWDEDPEVWDYWIRWWDGVLAGKPLDLEVQKAIALEIPDADWSEPKAVAAHIRRIEEREALRQEVAELRAQLAASQEALVANPAHRGHNNPPEVIDLPAEVREARSQIAAQLEIVSEELAKPRQSSAVLRKAGAALVAGAWVILRYCGRKADALITAAAVAGGTALGAMGAGLLAANDWERVIAFGKALIDYAGKWPWP